MSDPACGLSSTDDRRNKDLGAYVLGMETLAVSVMTTEGSTGPYIGYVNRAAVGLRLSGAKIFWPS